MFYLTIGYVQGPLVMFLFSPGVTIGEPTNIYIS